jgi:hypothetical protein
MWANKRARIDGAAKRWFPIEAPSENWLAIMIIL